MEGIPPVLDAAQGTPNSIASARAFGEFSREEGQTKTLAFKYCSLISFAVRDPSMVTCFLR